MEQEQEIWKPIIIEKNGVVYDYTGLYEVSNLGRVRSLNYKGHHGREHTLKLKLNNNEYKSVILYKNGKGKDFLVHRLVATAFIPNPDNLPQVNHKDENKQNNCVGNLEWCTNKYNTKYSSHKWSGEKSSMYGRKGEDAPNAKKVICLETKQVFGCIKDAQGWLGEGDIAQCLRGRSKTAGSYHWMYYEDYKRQLRLQTDIRNTQLIA